MSDNQKDMLSRWLPTLVAILAILGQVFYFGSRLGASETRLAAAESSVKEAVSRVEYVADRNSTITQFTDIKNSLQNISAKLDRIAERK